MFKPINKHSKNTFIQMFVLLLCLIMSASIVYSQNTTIEIEGYDISVLDAKIADAVAKANALGARTENKLAAAAAYLERANVFYNAGRPALYKLAVGDFRRVLRLQSNNAEAREKLDQIISIYKEMGRPVPTNGEETDIYNDPNVRYKLKPEPINLSSGRTSEPFPVTLPPNVDYAYEISAKSGTRIRVSVTSDDDSASLKIYQDRLDKSSSIVSGNKSWAGIVSDSEKYTIKVSSKKGNVTYKLKVTAQ
jgi:hypothetical protein